MVKRRGISYKVVMRFLTKLFASRPQSAPTTQSVASPASVTAPAPVVDDRDEFEMLDALIDRLNGAVILTAADKAKLDKKRREWMATFFDKTLDEGQTYGQASGDLEIFDQPEADFRAEICATDNDLKTQIDRFNHGLDRHFEYGEYHPPYYPWRIAVILSKRKELDREKRFLAAYCTHFWDRVGRRDQMILERAEKKGAFNRFSRGA